MGHSPRRKNGRMSAPRVERDSVGRHDRFGGSNRFTTGVSSVGRGRGVETLVSRPATRGVLDLTE